jgi:hypothetical protein
MEGPAAVMLVDQQQRGLGAVVGALAQCPQAATLALLAVNVRYIISHG